jgi:nicotinamide-nucleotide amidase
VACFTNSVLVRKRSGGRRPQAELLTIGSELLSGKVVNTNAAYLGRELTEFGFRVAFQQSCADEKRSIQEALRLALGRSEVVFVSGGLGPTPDDVTRESVAEYFGARLVFSKEQYREIARRYKRRGKKVPGIVRREAYFPENAKPVFNRFGIALGFVIEDRGRRVIVVPGVPGELERLFINHLRPYLKRSFPDLRPLASLVAKTIGLSEPTVMRRLSDRFFRLGRFQFGIYPDVGEVALRLYVEDQRLLGRLRARIRQVLGKDIYSYSEETIERVIGERLRTRGWTIGIAESCTGGEVSSLITKVPGSSCYLKGSVVPYDNRLKSRLLGVEADLLRRKGAVSREAAIQMARGVRERLATTLGLSLTGIAGPSGGSRGKPVGLVWIAIVSPSGTQVWKELFTGDRRQIQDRAAKKALEHLWRWTQR